MAKRKRDFKAEYARRQARGKAAGKTRQQARGHKPKEHVERARRSKAKYGVSPAVLTRLRRKAKDKLLILYRASARDPRRINENTIRRGMRLLHYDDLVTLIETPDIELIGRAAVQASADSFYDQMAEYFPVSIDDIEAADHNPYWYHR